MCQPKKKPGGRICMAGEMMDVIVNAGCLAVCKPSVAAQLPTIVPRLCETLHLPTVARYFMRDVRIGDTVALVDRENGVAFRLRMETHAVCVLGIYQNQRPPEDTPVVYLVNTHLLRSIQGRAVAA